MGKVLIPDKDTDQLVRTAFSRASQLQTCKLMDRLLAGAVHEEVRIPLLIFSNRSIQQDEKSE